MLRAHRLVVGGIVWLLASCQFPALDPIVDASVDADIDAVPDTTAPETTITASPAALSNTTGAHFTFTSNEAGTFTCQLDAEAAAPCTSPYDRTLAAGAHTFRVAAVDQAGNADPTPAEHSWTIDVVPPVTTITAAPPALDNSTTVMFEFNASETATFECSTDGGAFAACASPATVGPLNDGAHTYRVRATDAAGNVEPSPPSHSWTIDSSTPDTRIDSGPSGVSNVQNPSFTFSSPDAGAGATFECALDSPTFTTCSSPVGYTALDEGSHTFRVRVRDASSNVDPTPATRTWTVDLTGPETTIDAGPSGAVSSTSATFMFSSNEAGATFECSLDSGAYAACPASHTITGLGQGSHTLAVRAVDLGGNSDTSPASRTWTVDTVAPTVTISAPAAGATTGASVAVAFSVNETATTTCRLDGAAAQACATGVQYTLASGSHSVEVLATDTAGNVGSLTRSWTVDTTNPDTTIVTGPTGAVSSTSASFTFSSDDAAATFECSLDAGAFAACPASHTLSGLGQGSHTLQVRAVDAVGNRDSSPASRTWTVDTVAPSTSIASGPPALTSSASATFDFTSEAGATFQCNLDNTGFSACSDPATFTVADGAHQLQVRAVDAAGNIDATPAAHSWTADTTPPGTTIVAAPPATTASTSATFDFSSEAGATFQCRLDAAAFTSCADPFTFSTSEGAHTLQVRAVDPAGNVDPSPASHTWTIDATPPTTTIDAGPTGAVASTSAAFMFSSNEAGATFECNLDGGGFAACPATHNLMGLAQGAHSLQVRAVDAAGNRDQTPAGRMWTVDTVNPVVTITAPVAGAMIGPRVRVDFTATETGTATCRFDTQAAFACTPGTFANLPAGPHTVEVEVTDAAGNRGATSHAFMVECPLPGGDLSTLLLLHLEEEDGTDSLVNQANAANPAFKGITGGPDPGDPVSVLARYGRGLSLQRVATVPAKHANWMRQASTQLDELSVELWVYPQASQDGWVFTNNSAVDLDDSIGLYHNTVLDTVYAYGFDKTGAMGTQTDGIPIARDRWHHVVVTYADRELTLWLDGVPTTRTITFDLSFQLKMFKLGWQGGSFPDAFEGMLDEVVVWNRALTPAEVLDRYCPVP